MVGVVGSSPIAPTNEIRFSGRTSGELSRSFIGHGVLQPQGFHFYFSPSPICPVDPLRVDREQQRAFIDYAASMTQGSVSALTHLRQRSVRRETLQGTGAIDRHKAGKRVAGRLVFDVRHLFAIEDGWLPDLHFTHARHVDFRPLRLQRQRSDQPGGCVHR